MSTASSYPASSKSEPLPMGTTLPVKERDPLSELNASRVQLRSALMGIAHPPTQPSLLSNGLGGVGKQLLERAHALPGANAIEEGVQAWWQKSRLRKVAALAGPGAMPLLSSLGRKHPRALLLTSAAGGAVLMIAPWRRIVFRLFRPAVLAGLLFEVVKAAMRRQDRPAASKLNRK